MAARREDKPYTYVHVDGISGEVGQGDDIPSAPTGQAVGEGRRHRIALTGFCELCGGDYAIVFTQHKGQTHVETVSINHEPRYETGQDRE